MDTPNLIEHANKVRLHRFTVTIAPPPPHLIHSVALPHPHLVHGVAAIDKLVTNYVACWSLTTNMLCPSFRSQFVVFPNNVHNYAHLPPLMETKYYAECCYTLSRGNMLPDLFDSPVIQPGLFLLIPLSHTQGAEKIFGVFHDGKYFNATVRKLFSDSPLDIRVLNVIVTYVWWQQFCEARGIICHHFSLIQSWLQYSFLQTLLIRLVGLSFLLSCQPKKQTEYF